MGDNLHGLLWVLEGGDFEKEAGVSTLADGDGDRVGGSCSPEDR